MIAAQIRVTRLSGGEQSAQGTIFDTVTPHVFLGTCLNHNWRNHNLMPHLITIRGLRNLAVLIFRHCSAFVALFSCHHCFDLVLCLLHDQFGKIAEKSCLPTPPTIVLLAMGVPAHFPPSCSTGRWKCVLDPALECGSSSGDGLRENS